MTLVSCMYEVKEGSFTQGWSVFLADLRILPTNMILALPNCLLKAEEKKETLSKNC